MLKVDGAVIHYPVILYKGNATINLYKSWTGGTNPGITPRWTLMDRHFLEHGLPDDPGVSAFIIEHKDKETEEIAKELEKTIRETLRRYNVGNANKNVTIKRMSLQKLGDDQLREALSEVKEKQSDGRKKLVFLVLPGRDRSIYPAFKDMADREFGLQAICMTEGKLFSGEGYNRKLKKVEQYLGNVMMKANIKCGGINHTAGGPVDPKSMSYMTAMTDQIKDTMLLGADVTHPSVASIEGCPSIAAMVGSVDNRGGKFLGSMRLQDQEKKDREVL
jgi:eukaryotic translation initiation factor 2C